MIEQICAFIHNFFDANRYTGTFTISDGRIYVPQLVQGQYFRIIGSMFNDGVYQYGFDQLTDETFEGEVWDMRPPRAFIRLALEVEDWQAKYGDIVNSPYQSESFGGYSYTKSGGSYANGNDTMTSWESAFRTRLNQYRKLA